MPWVYAIARHVRVDQFRKSRRTAQNEEVVETEVLQEKPRHLAQSRATYLILKP